MASAAAPDISGRYSLGVETGRFVEITAKGGNEYSIANPGDQYPFHGDLTWTGGQHFQGPAAFENSAATMRVVIDRQLDGTLDTRFEFLTNDQGFNYPSQRVDQHMLIPIK